MLLLMAVLNWQQQISLVTLYAYKCVNFSQVVTALGHRCDAPCQGAHGRLRDDHLLQLWTVADYHVTEIGHDATRCDGVESDAAI
jgi:hypothetical protein